MNNYLQTPWKKPGRVPNKNWKFLEIAEIVTIN